VVSRDMEWDLRDGIHRIGLITCLFKDAQRLHNWCTLIRSLCLNVAFTHNRIFSYRLFGVGRVILTSYYLTTILHQGILDVRFIYIRPTYMSLTPFIYILPIFVLPQCTYPLWFSTVSSPRQPLRSGYWLYWLELVIEYFCHFYRFVRP
jgi:hypothetical protein